MPLKDFLDYISTSQEPLTFDSGGRCKTYTGILTIVKKTSTNPKIGTYRDFQLTTKDHQHPNLGSAEIENDFSRNNTIKDGRIVAVREAA